MTQVRQREVQRIFEAAVARYQMYPEYRDSGVEWLGEIPAHWKIERLKYATALNPEILSENTLPDYFIEYVDISNVNALGEILEVLEYRFEDAPSRARRVVRQGDTIISTVRTYLKAIAFFENPPDNLIVSTGFAVLRPKPNLHPKFLAYVVQAVEFIDTVVANSTGVSYPAIAPSRLGDLPLWFPASIKEQRAIAAFLDRQTAKIDALIAKKHELLAALHEKRSAIISHAVTKGLNPDAPMKDSGIEWLGEIPAGWEVVRVKYVSSSLQTGPFGSQLHADEYVIGGVPVVNPSHLQNGRIVSDENVTVDEETWVRLSRHQLFEGDIVFARRGEMGRAAIVTEHEVGWLCGTGSIRVRLLPDFCYPPYVNLVFSLDGVRDWLSIKSVGSTMENLNTQIIGELPIPLPSTDEQRAITIYIRVEWEKIDTMTAKVEATIERLQEYRAAVISAAVTGKINVRGEVL